MLKCLVMHLDLGIGKKVPLDRVVVCMKWGTLFSADYVNVLFRAALANTSTGFRFICLTDHSEGLAQGIVVAPIPDIGLTPEQISAPGVWRKLALFHPEVATLAGVGSRILFIDLDMMVIGALDRFFEPLGEMILLDTGHDWRAREPVQPSTGVFAFTAGEQRQILDAFQVDPERAIAQFRNEQDFVSAHARQMSLWPTGAVISFKRHLVRRYSRDLVYTPPPPCSGPAILAFHGDPRPADLLRLGVWGRFPHLGRGPVGWVRDYWSRYGGRLPMVMETTQ
jgi:hypothetical protein